MHKRIDHFKFSLVELLVVVGILAVVASLLQPSLVKVLSNAQRMSCSENLRHIGAATYLYADDNDDYVGDCLFIGSITSNFMFTNNTAGNYRAARNAGRFHNGQAGYLEPYLGDNESSYVCPGTEYAQGVKEFGTSRFTSRVSTYTSLSPFNFQLRKLTNRFLINPLTDERLGYDKQSIKPLFLDPIKNMSAWYSSRIGQGGSWDQVGLKVHQNAGQMPILMDDGHVMFYDRTFYPSNFISQTGYTNTSLLINQIFEQL